MADSSLPPLYARWVQDLLGAPVPREARSTCATCALCGEDAHPGPTFRPDVKCCQFTPKLPNFLAGEVLRAGTDAGRASVRARIAAGQAVSPLGLGCAPEYAAAYEQMKARGEFGNRLDLRCPHFLEADGGTCAIWAQRESVCTTWFCRYERGAASRQLWSALQRLLETAEGVLARWAAAEEGAGKGWGPWQGREEALYEACAARVAPLELRDLRRLGGLELRLKAGMVRAAWEELARPGVPARLTRGPARVAPRGDGAWRLWSYSPYDPLDLSAEELAALDRFDGRPVAEVLRDWPEAPTEARIQALSDWRALVWPEDEQERDPLAALLTKGPP